MSDLRLLRDLVDQFPPPDFDDLARISSRRRRRATVAALVGVTAATLAVVVAISMNGVPRTADPVKGPTDAPSSYRDTWPLERIRAEGGLSEVIATPAEGTGLAARMWSVCVGADCGDMRGSANDDERYLMALELTLDGYRTSSLHEVNDPWHPATNFIEAFDDDTVFVRDAARPDSERDRFRLLDASGEAVTLALLDSKAPAAPGPDVVLLFSTFLYRVDAEAGTIQPLDVPAEVRMWAGGVDEFLWGIADMEGACAVYWLQPDGTFGRRQLECGTGSLSIIERLTGGEMAVEVLNREGVALAVHVSVDGGATWRQVRPQDAPAILSTD